MKKQIIQYGIMAVLLLPVLISCKKAIELEPSHNVDGSKFFTKIPDYELSLTGTYARLLQDNYYGNGNTGAGPYVGLPDMMSDNLFESSESLANFQNFSRWNYVADDPSVQDVWEDGDRAVQQANITLRGIGK